MTNSPDPSAEIPVVHPALSDDQWPYMQEVVASHPSGKLGWFIMARRAGNVLELEIHGDFKQWIVDDTHALAALCLYGTPEGFTQEDVDELLWNATMADPMTPVEWKIENGVRNAFAIAGRLRTLADRISALLPPKSHP
jgi:hypothetical protein